MEAKKTRRERWDSQKNPDSEKINVLMQQQQVLGDTTLFDFAGDNEQFDFVGHWCYQKTLSSIWKGPIRPNTPIWKVLVAVFLPFILFGLPDFRMHVGSRIGFRQRSAQYRERIYSFYNAPVTKFVCHTLSYLLCLVVFSIFILTDLHPIDQRFSISFCEMFTWIWAISMLCEEFRQMIAEICIVTERPSKGKSIYQSIYQSTKGGFRRYLDSRWNQFDLFNHFIMTISVILRFVLPTETFFIARAFYSITFILYCMRILNVFFAFMKVGVLVVVFGKMLLDLLSFIAILLTFLVAYGIAIHAVQYPNSRATWDLPAHIFSQPYWNLYGELFLDRGEMGHCTENVSLVTEDSGIKLCQEQSWLTVALLAIYMLLTNVILLSILIAKFSYTFSNVQKNSEKVIGIHRVKLVKEFGHRPLLMPPFIILTHIYRVAMHLKKICQTKSACETDGSSSSAKGNGPHTIEKQGKLKVQQQDPILAKINVASKLSDGKIRNTKLMEDLEDIKSQLHPTWNEKEKQNQRRIEREQEWYDLMEETSWSFGDKPKNPPNRPNTVMDELKEMTEMRKKINSMQEELQEVTKVAKKSLEILGDLRNQAIRANSEPLLHTFHE